MASRAAVVIGVGLTGSLQPLESPVPGATSVAQWLEGEGYEVRLLTDRDGPLHAHDVKLTLQELVTKPPLYDMLVVYFSGHGYWHARTEVWLFNDAPDDGSDAINLRGAMDLAQTTGIPNVVFISDACRDLPANLAAAGISGIDAIPNLAMTTTGKVDSLIGAGKARSAYEAVLHPPGDGAGVRESIFTKALLAAYEEPTSDMILPLQVDGQQVHVVPNRRLEKFMQKKVDDLLFEVNPQYQQTVEINVPSADDVYIARAQVGRAERPEGSALPRPGGGGPASLRPVARPAERLLAAIALGHEGEVLGDPELAVELSDRMPNYRARDHYESGCGLVVTGAPVAQAAVVYLDPERPQTEVHADVFREAEMSMVRLWGVEPAVSVVVQLADGRSSVVAAFEGYLAYVHVGEAGISSVSYVPSPDSGRADTYQDRRDNVDLLRATVSMAVDVGAFHVADPAEARRLADRIRMEKGLDPALGIYAAHAYAMAGLEEAIADVAAYMFTDLEVSIFDVALLASRVRPFDERPIVPFCPVLTQSWNLLRTRGVELPRAIEDLVPHLTDSLWTTFDDRAAGALLQQAQLGGLR